MDQIGDQVTGDVVDAMDQNPHELGRECVASDHESTYLLQSTSDTVMEPANGSPLTQDPEQILNHVSEKDDIVSWLDGGRTPSQLRTSPGRITPSDEGFGPEFMEFQKSADGTTSPIEQELQTLLANKSTQPITNNLKAEDEVRLANFTSDVDLLNKLEVPIPQTHQPTETCNGKRPDEETNLPGVEVKPTEIEIGGQLQTIPVIAINGKHQIPIWKQFDQTANRPELNNAAPSQSSNAIGPSHPSTYGTPVRGSKRKAKGNERGENKFLKGVPLHARELTDDEELNNRIRKAQTTKRYHDEKKRREEELTSTVEELKSKVEELTSTVEELSSQLEESQKENTDLKSKNITQKSQLA